MEQPYSKREIDYFMTEIKREFDDFKDEMRGYFKDAANERKNMRHDIDGLKLWKARFAGGIAVIIALVLPLAFLALKVMFI